MGDRKVIEWLAERCRRAGFPEFAWWIPLVMDGMTFLAGAVAVGQRLEGGHALPAAGLVLVALSPWVLFIAGRPLPLPAFMLVTMASSVVLMVRYPVEYDFTLLIWVMLVGDIAAKASLRHGLLATAVAGGTLVALGWAGLMEGTAFWLAGLLAAFDVGFVMQYQQRQLDEQRRAAADRQAQAVLAERQRIAREVHDVIAHSLSVTMLHLTAARRSLEEDEPDIAEAVDALRDAETAGRGAMTDIRHTVGLLGRASDTVQAAPDARAVPALVEQFRTAGLDVALDLRGDPAEVPTNAGLGVYRIVQESLANVAKHQPGARTGVLLELAADRQRVKVWTSIPPGHRAGPGGSGLEGMRQRAELLRGSFTAGPRDGTWVVEAELPAPSGTRCPLGLSRGGAAARQDPAAEPA